ncbi:MAG: hypothetical protein MUF22_08315 [Chitinispirillaceae bacterium]|jgi:hypothetical protein|nr:hypothetical protein [Chitinispirillaceae bacterium]
MESEYATFERPRTREFRYGPFHITRFFTSLFFLGLVLVAWIPVLYLYVTVGFMYAPVLRATLFLTGSFVLLLIVGRISRAELNRVRFVISPNGIGRIDGLRKTQLPWREVTAIRYRRFPFVKGFIEIISAKGKLILPSTIIGFGLLGESLKTGLDNANRSRRGTLMSDRMLRKIAIMGMVSELWNERARLAFWPLIAATVSCVLFCAFIAARIWGLEPVALIIWSGLGLPAPILAYSIADFRQNRRIEHTHSHSTTDPWHGFSGELCFGALIVALIYGIAGIVFSGLFLK